MKKSLLLLIAVILASATVVAKPKEIKLIQDSPRECLKSHKSRLICEENDVTIVPHHDEKHTRFTVDQHFDLTNYKALSFTLVNLEEKPIQISLFIADSRKNVTKFRRTLPETTGDVYFLQPGEKREVVLNFPEDWKSMDVVNELKLMRYTPYSREFGFHSYSADLKNVNIISFHCRHLAMNATKAVKGWKIEDLKIIP
ncbi:MAG: hypothetical protein IKY24_07455, partial [Alistipes sp.]|nr:hypothetical protein [Alistipes sp.]